jgi:hypothetical protein
MNFLLHLTYASGAVETLRFASAFDRSLWVIALAAQPVTFTLEDPS